jgi:ketosteroid isomerase-like protein
VGAKDEITELLATYERALNTDDTALAVSCYTSDGVFMPTTLPTATGPALTKAYDQTFAAIHLAVTFNIDELVVASETIAYALTRSNGTQTVHSTGTGTVESNREVFIFAFEDGVWKISRYLFNKPE